MEARAQSGAPPRSGATAAKPERPRRRLEAAEQPTAGARRSIADVGTLLVVGLSAACLALAALHAMLVENQAALDDLIERNQQRHQHIDKLHAEIAYLDSPEGLAEQAESVGLVPSADLVVLGPVAPGLLAPPLPDPFGLESSGWMLQKPGDPPVSEVPEPAAGAPEPGNGSE